MKISNVLKKIITPVRFTRSIYSVNLVQKCANMFVHNRGMLYLLFAFSILSIISFVNERRWTPIVIFMLTAFLVSFFYKNMVAVMGVALLTSYVIYFFVKQPFEGLETMTDPNEKEGMEEEEKEEEKEGMETKDKDTSDKDNKNKDKKDKKDKPSESSASQQKKDYDDLKGDYAEFQGIQKKIMDGVNDMNPLLDKADKFLEKMEAFQSKYGN